MGKREQHKAHLLKDYIGEKLNRLEGHPGLDKHRSEGFHFRVAESVPKGVVMMILSKLSDHMENVRAGREKKLSDISAYFGGMVKNTCAAMGIDITNIDWSSEAVFLEEPERVVTYEVPCMSCSELEWDIVGDTAYCGNCGATQEVGEAPD